MKTILQTALVSACISLGGAVYAQQAGQDNPPAQHQPSGQGDQDDSQRVAYTGCLTKAGGGEQYMIVDQKSGERASFAASNKIDKYLNQTVTLTGRVSSQGGEKAFQPETVKLVSASCEPPSK